MTLGQLPAETRPAWWVREQRIHVTADGTVVYDPRLWWPMELAKHVGRAWRAVRYSTRWQRPRPMTVERYAKVETYRRR